MSRLIDADALIDDLKHDVAADQDSLDYEELTDSNREIIQFDKDCKQNAIDLLQNAPTIEPQRWIPCSERLPEKGQDILAYEVFGDDERIIPANYDNGCWFDCHMNCSVEHIIAWMPLPSPYRKEGEE